MKTCWKRDDRRLNGFSKHIGGKRVRFNSSVVERKPQKQGTTLIEVVLGLLILAIMVVMLVMSLRHPRYIVVNTTYRQAALHAAIESLEEAVAQGYTHNHFNRAETVPSDNLDSVYSLHGRGVSGSRTVTDWDAESPPTLLVTVSVNYPAMDAPVVLETLLTP